MTGNEKKSKRERHGLSKTMAQYISRAMQSIPQIISIDHSSLTSVLGENEKNFKDKKVQRQLTLKEMHPNPLSRIKLRLHMATFR